MTVDATTRRGGQRKSRVRLVGLALAASGLLGLPATAGSEGGAAPAIHTPRVFGVRPGSPFLLTVAATGERPMAFSARGLPAGLRLDAVTGQITCTLSVPGEHRVLLRATNGLGAFEEGFRATVRPHGVVLIRVTPAGTPASGRADG